MSSSLVSKTDIDGLVTAALRCPHDSLGGFTYYTFYNGVEVFTVTRETADRVGAMLWRYNMEAADFGEEAERVNAYVFEELPGEPSPLLVLRMCSHYGYQVGGDPEGWPRSEAFAFLQCLKASAIQSLPGMDDLPWGLSDRNAFADGSGK